LKVLGFEQMPAAKIERACCFAQFGE